MRGGNRLRNHRTNWPQEHDGHEQCGLPWLSRNDVTCGQSGDFEPTVLRAAQPLSRAVTCTVAVKMARRSGRSKWQCTSNTAVGVHRKQRPLPWL